MKRYAVLLLATVLISAQSPPEVEITAEPHHHLVLANDQVRVFRVEVAPHAETLMHWHRHDYIYVTLAPTEVVNAVKGKDPVTIKLQEGEVRFVSTGFAHIARNVSDQPFRNVTIEILQDKLRLSPSQWDEDRGLEILQGGTKEILFVKGGIRVAEVELQPKGTLPLSAGPQLLVALSNLDLLQGTPQRNLPVHAGMHIMRKAGEVEWLPASHLKELECMGHPAKFITLEFPQR
jgi:quercetin dioxygenase-like cupin family protein